MTDDIPSLAYILSDYESADQVAERIGATGVKAVPGDPCECAVARYVKLYFADAEVYNEDEIHFVVYADDEVFFIDEDHPMGEFIRAFDAGRYPQLVAEGAA